MELFIKLKLVMPFINWFVPYIIIIQSSTHLLIMVCPQSSKCLYKWHAGFGAKGLAVVQLYFEKRGTMTDEEWRDSVQDLLNNNKYIYGKTHMVKGEVSTT